MGAHNFEHFEAGTDPEKCYQRAVDDALHEHGHDGYNGTISTTGGWRLHQQMPVTMEQAYEIAGASLDQYQKWEACGAIPIVNSGAVDTREVTCEVHLPGGGELYDRQADVKALVKATVKVKAGEEVLSYEIEQPRHRWDGSQSIKEGREVETIRKVTVEATTGKTETRYVCQGPGINLRKWEEMHKTQSAARTALTDWLKGGGGQTRDGHSAANYEIVGITRRVDGEPVVKGYAEVVKRVIPIKAKVGKRTSTGEVEGYLFFGWAAC